MPRLALRRQRLLWIIDGVRSGGRAISVGASGPVRCGGSARDRLTYGRPPVLGLQVMSEPFIAERQWTDRIMTGCQRQLGKGRPGPPLAAPPSTESPLAPQFAFGNQLGDHGPVSPARQNRFGEVRRTATRPP